MNEKEILFQAAGEIQFYSALVLKFFNEAIESRLRQQGAEISALQHGILSMLMIENLTISVISQRLVMDPSTLVRSIDKLERQGLVARGRNPKDRRQNPISITDKGRELIYAVPPIAYEDLPFHALHTLGTDSVLQLRNLLRDLINQMPEGKLILDLISGYSPRQE